MSTQDIDRNFDLISRISHTETVLDIIDIRLAAGLKTRTTLEGLQESIRFTREYIARMKEQQS